jgi:YggT family protein
VVIICQLFTVAVIALIVYVVLSWVPRPPEPLIPVQRALHRVVDPLLSPIRRILPPVQLGGMALDLSVLVLFFAIAILQSILCA